MHKKISLAVLCGLFPVFTYSAQKVINTLPQQEKSALHKTVVITQEHLNSIIQNVVSALMKVDEIRQNSPAINDEDVVAVVESLVDTAKPLIEALSNVIKELEVIIDQKNSLPSTAKKEYSRIIKECVVGIDIASMQEHPQKAMLNIINTVRSKLAQAERLLKN